MRRTILGAGLVVAAIASVWWWRARTEANPAPPAGETARATASSTSSMQRSPELPASATTDEPARAARTVPAPEPQVNHPATQNRIADAHAHLQDAVKPCRALVTPKPSPDAQFQFGYRLTIAGGEARVSDLSLVWSDYKSAEVEKCLLDKLGAVRWPTAEPDWSTTVEDALTAAELD